MNIGSYLGGVAWFACVSIPLVVGGWCVRARILPGWRGSRARLAEGLLVVASMLAVAFVLGSAGLFRRWPVAVGCVLVGALASWIARGGTPKTRPVSEDDFRWRGLTVLDAVAIAFATFAVGRWIPGTLDALRSGPTDADSLIYHLPHAVRFVQDGWLTRLHFVTPSDMVPYHPSNGEVFHAYGVLAFGRDFLSPLMNLGWLVFALGAAWVFGERWRSGSLAVIATATMFAVPVMVDHQAGSAHTDVVATGLLVTALAMLVHAEGGRVPVVLGGIAAGIALGSKFSTVVPVALLTLSVIVVTIRRKRALVPAFAIGLVAMGSFWYVRNLIHVGNPVPSMGLRVGPLELPRTPIELIDRYGYSVADYAFEGRIWRDYFVPGLDAGFGDAWFTLIILSGIGAVFWLKATPAIAKTFAFVAAGAVVAWAFTPTTAYGARGRPEFFVFNLRYVVPGLLVGLVAVSATVSSRWLIWLFVAGCGVVVLAELPHGWDGQAQLAIAAMAAVGGAVAAARYVLVRTVVGAVAVGIVALVAVAAMYPVANGYVGRRLGVNEPSPTENPALWAQHVSGARIGVVGFFINYPLYGSDLSNRVDYVGELHPDNAFTDHRSCEAFLQDVNQGGYDHVVTAPSFPQFPEPQAAEWMMDTAATQVAGEGKTRVFEIRKHLDPDRCPTERRSGSGSDG